MGWLLWKDLRLARPILVVAAILLIAPHGIAVLMAYHGHSRLAGNLRGSVVVSLFLAQIPLLLLGGLAMAGERQDRSAEFLACQPVPRSRILLSKLLVVFALVAVTWTVNLAVLAIALIPNAATLDHLEVMTSLLPPIIAAILGQAFFGMAWLFSSWLESPTFAACAGLVVPIAVMGGISWIIHLLGITEGQFLVASASAWLALALAGFVGGTVHYLRRVEP